VDHKPSCPYGHRRAASAHDWRHASASKDFDATVVAKYEPAKVQIVRRHDEPTRHGAAPGLGWGLATGAVAALFPP
jgi:hypothetical protein